MKNFVLIGAAGYVAPRHMRAIKDTKNSLAAALDKSDSVGILDSYFPNCNFFTEFERFDRHIHKLQRSNSKFKLDYLSICSPNYLHDSHIRFGLRSGLSVISEKPLVLNPWNLDALKEIEKETGNRTSTILQLRIHPTIIALKKELKNKKKDIKNDMTLTYVTSRGFWYNKSWKGDISKSGGLATNIGIHFFDLLHHLFGKSQNNILHYHDLETASGFLEFQNARVRWFLSTNGKFLPSHKISKGQNTYRSIEMNSKELEFSSGFDNLHTVSYEQILNGKGFCLEDNRQAIETVFEIRKNIINVKNKDVHPFLKKVIN